MGISWITRSELYHIYTMKFLIVSALVAAASAEAQFAYAGYPYATGYGYAGHHLAYAGYPYAHHAYAAAVPFGSSTGLDPITQGLDPVTQGVAYHKREAEADAEPQVLSHAAAALPYAGYGYGYNGLTGYAGYPYSAAYGYAAAPYGYAGLGHHYGYYGKRSADADAQIVAPYAAHAYAGYPYAAHAYAGYPYTNAYAGYPYAHAY